MKIIDDILYIEYAELIEVGCSANTLKRAKSSGYKSWEFLSDPKDNRRVLVKYELLADKYKDALSDKYGNVYDYVAKLPIKQMVKFDLKAEQYYLDFTYSGDKTLSRAHVDKYTKSANWLNMILEATSDKRELKAKLNLTIDQFYMHTMELFKVENVDLPQSYGRLANAEDSALKKYAKNGYVSLISKHFGNNRSAKVNDEKCEAVLLDLIAHPNQYDAVFIATQYNVWALANGYATISDKTVLHHKQKNIDEITMEREGMASFKDKRSRKIRGHRPTQPLYLVEGDDNHTDLFFRDQYGDHVRYKAIVIMDSYNDYLLGYAYTTGSTTKELVRAAYVNAMYYLKSITGSWHLPHETKSDKFAISDLTPFYESMGAYIPARHGNKNRGYIEPAFGTNFFKNCMKIGANNYTGHNITASNRGVNAEQLTKNKSLRPFVGGESIAQIEQFFSRLRHMKQSNGSSKHEEWLSAWEKLGSENKREISDEQFLMKFGIQARHRGNGVRLDTKGLRFQLDNRKYDYQLDEYSTALLGKSVEVIYDINDMSRVLLTDHDKIRLIAKETQLNPRALKDHTTDSINYVRRLQEEQNAHTQKVVDKISNRKKILSSNFIDAESVILAGILDKDVRQIAEQEYYELPPSTISKQSDSTEYDPYEDM